MRGSETPEREREREGGGRKEGGGGQSESEKTDRWARRDKLVDRKMLRQSLFGILERAAIVQRCAHAL